MGDYAQAEPLYRQAMEIRRKRLGEDHPDYATSLNNLAALYEARATTPRPSRSTARRWRSGRRPWARTTPTTPPSLNNLAVLYQAMGDYAQAEPLYRQALEIRKKAPGRGPSRLRHQPEQPGLCCTVDGQLRAAEPLYQQAMEIRKKALGEEPSRLRRQPEQPGRAVPGDGRLRPRRPSTH